VPWIRLYMHNLGMVQQAALFGYVGLGYSYN